MSPDDPRHGTYAGYRAHRTAKVTPCAPCRAANTERQKARYAKERIARTGLELSVRLPRSATASDIWARAMKQPNGCWNWIAPPRTSGYCATVYQGRRVYVHRLAVELVTGEPIPTGMEVDHICHNKTCFNPDHLRVVGRRQNNQNHAGATHASRSGVRGVWWSEQHGRWTAQVQHLGTRHTLGTFADIAEAERAVVAKRNELHTHNDYDRRDAS